MKKATAELEEIWFKNVTCVNFGENTMVQLLFENKSGDNHHYIAPW